MSDNNAVSAGGNPVDVMVEIKMPQDLEIDQVIQAAEALLAEEFKVTGDCIPIPISPPAKLVTQLEASRQKVYLLSGLVSPDRLPALEQHPSVIKVTQNNSIEPFA